MTEQAADPSVPRSWVALVECLDQPGALMALASVFAERGVNFTSLATGALDGRPGAISLTFVATARQCQVLRRAAGRLTVVTSLVLRPFDHPGARAAGVVRMPPGIAFRPPAEVDVMWSGDSAAGQPVLVEGTLAAVAAVAAAAREAGALTIGTVISEVR
ncbi:hypothetical protein GA0111570_113108 [Raineyella antarctica]|uniref:ACT domain-containing protein n=1 Tax=Raineyella antarctica TaxID=1577474 RepID=A0A1G6I1K1_9ACTN|nr:hypothetical protein [Raineyella antarctica]SDC00278.1 hypothetical protein GA0111570_113108 [Raineyella antarctica]